jgi:hypothetical protein
VPEVRGSACEKQFHIPRTWALGRALYKVPCSMVRAENAANSTPVALHRPTGRGGALPVHSTVNGASAGSEWSRAGSTLGGVLMVWW